MKITYHGKGYWNIATDDFGEADGSFSIGEFGLFTALRRYFKHKRLRGILEQQRDRMNNATAAPQSESKQNVKGDE